MQNYFDERVFDRAMERSTESTVTTKRRDKGSSRHTNCLKRRERIDTRWRRHLLTFESGLVENY